MKHLATSVLVAGFVTVESDIYPQLSGYYREQAQLWLTRKQDAQR